MPSQEEIMQQILDLVSEGAGMPLTPEIETALRKRYSDWIVNRKDGVPTSPQEIWNEKEGQDIQEKLREVGRQLTMKHVRLKLSKDEIDTSCLMVESLSECPHCPIPPGG
jgi:hypothetical protein